MSTLTQFLGGGVTVGGYAPVISTYGVNFSVNGQEFLQSGYLKAYSSSYASLLNASKLLGSKNVAPVSTSFAIGGSYYEAAPAYSMFSYTSGGTTYYYLLNTYYGSAGEYPLVYSTSLSSAPSNVTWSYYATPAYFQDMLVFNNKLLCTRYAPPPSTNDGSEYLMTVTAGAASNTLTMNYGNSSRGGFKLLASSTLCIMVSNKCVSGSSGATYTSTDGVNFTARTSNLSFSGNYIARAEYLSSAGLFIFITDTGNIYTTPDGYTFTQRTAPSGMNSPGSGINSSFYKNFSSSISGLAMFWMAGSQFMYTTDGVTYTLSDIQNYSQNPLTFNVFYTGNNSYCLGNDGTRILIGNTWTNYLAYTTTGINCAVDFRRIGYVTYGFSNSNYTQRCTGIAKIGSSIYLLSEWWSPRTTYVADITGTIATASPSFIGQQSALSWASGSSFSSYLRIA